MYNDQFSYVEIFDEVLVGFFDMIVLMDQSGEFFFVVYEEGMSIQVGILSVWEVF